jgi:hypothetical protein
MKRAALPFNPGKVLPGHLYMTTALVIAQTLMLTLGLPGWIQHGLNIGFSIALGFLLEKITGAHGRAVGQVSIAPTPLRPGPGRGSWNSAAGGSSRSLRGSPAPGPRCSPTGEP